VAHCCINSFKRVLVTFKEVNPHSARNFCYLQHMEFFLINAQFLSFELEVAP